MRYLLSLLIACYILLLRLTCRVEIVGGKTLPAVPHIFACWHGRLLLSAPLWLKRKPRGMRMTMLSSSHKDGVMIANACKLIGFNVVFGSSTRGGANALRGLVAAAKAGHAIFITPDGPKGPRYEAKGGVVDAARLTGLAILPFSTSARGKTMRSWDQFLFIKPFSKIYVELGTPIAPPTKENRDQVLYALTQQLVQLEQQADNHVHA